MYTSHLHSPSKITKSYTSNTTFLLEVINRDFDGVNVMFHLHQNLEPSLDTSSRDFLKARRVGLILLCSYQLLETWLTNQPIRNKYINISLNELQKTIYYCNRGHMQVITRALGWNLNKKIHVSTFLISDMNRTKHVVVVSNKGHLKY